MLLPPAPILVLLLGLTVPVKTPLECIDAKGKVVVPASEIRQVGQGVSPPEGIQKVRPEWPKGVRQLGPIIAEAVIDSSGRVCTVRILRAPSNELGEAVRAALRAARFRPARIKGQAVPVHYIVTVHPHPQ